MALTVNEAFDELLKRIELNPARVTTASQRYNSVKKTIEAALPNKTVKQVGSFQRKTKIRPIDLSDELDIDAIVSFGQAYQIVTDGSGITPSEALQIIRSALTSNDIYKVMEPIPDAPVVVLEYADKPKFKIELAPAFVDKTGQHNHPPNGPDCYIVGKTDGNWHPADYDYDAAMISGLNQEDFTQNTLVPSVKMLKAFLRGMDVPLKSFHVEILVALTIPPALTNWKLKGYTWGYKHILAQFLDSSPSVLSSPVRLPGSYSEPVTSDLSIQELQSVGTWMRKRAEEAWKLCKIKDEDNASRYWAEFFGEPFPK